MAFSLFENAPTLVFVLVMTLTDDPRVAGWNCALAAALVCACYARGSLRPDPIVLGINL
ncbi:MAG: hypothetical protein AAF264_09025 [Pseudomonadota bacterium]